MTGFLDRHAPNIPAEYSRYLDGDILGKILAKNLLLNVLGYSDDRIFIPLGRYGNADVKYATPDKVLHDPGDGHVMHEDRKVTFEIKCARINIANRSRGSTQENWAFSNVRTTPKRVPKKYDVLIAVGLRTLGLEDERYWKYLEQVKALRAKQKRHFNVTSAPHEASFLATCSFFIMPMKEVPTNNFRLHVDAVDKGIYGKFRGWGDESERCRKLWRQAVDGSVET